MRNRKAWLIAFCLVLCLASAAFCIDPFKANRGGFGPKIKGLRLGQKMSLMDIFVWRAHFKGFPFVLKVQGAKGANGVEDNYITIDFSGNGKELESSGIREAKGSFSDLQDKVLKLGDLLIELEKRNVLKVDTLDYKTLRSEELIGYNVNNRYARWRMVFGENDKERRIRKLQFFTSDFGAESLTDEEFLQMFINAYEDIPRMSTKRARKWDTWYMSGEYRNPSQGWQVVYDWLIWDTKTVFVEPIITQTSFD